MTVLDEPRLSELGVAPSPQPYPDRSEGRGGRLRSGRLRSARLRSALDWVAAPVAPPRFGVDVGPDVEPDVEPDPEPDVDLSVDLRVDDHLDAGGERPAERTDVASPRSVRAGDAPSDPVHAPRRRTAVPDPRIAARRRQVHDEVRSRRHTARIAAVVAVAAVVAAVVAGAGIARSSLLDVRTISVDGAEMTGAVAVATAGGVRAGASMFDIDTDAIARRIEALDTIDSARVERHWPDTVRIVVTERIAVAAIEAKPGVWVTVDGSGAILSTMVTPPRLTRLVASGPVGTGQGAVIEGSLTPADAAAAALIAGLPPAARGRLNDVRVERGSIVAGLVIDDRRVQVVFGRADDAAAKGRALLTVLSGADPAGLLSIDLSVPDVPILARG